MVEGSAPPRWDPAARVLTVSVPKGEMHENVLISSVMDPNAVTSMGLYRWLLEEGIAAPRMDQLRQLAGSGQHWMFTPYRQITIVHAVQQPIDPPKFGPNFRAGRAVGDTYAILADDNLYVHGNSTQKINIGGTWTEWVDLRAAGPPLQVPGQSVAFETQVFYGQKQLVLPPDSANGFRHEFHDTKHRKVTYSCVATTRYPQFFADKNLQPTDFQRPSATVDLHVPSSKRPDAPSLLYIVPQFKWERSANATKRSGGGLRIYLDRPWYSSGDDEKLAVLLAPTGGLLPAAAVNPTLEPYVTLWGKDPIWNTAPARNAELGVGDFPLAVQSLAGDKPPLVLTLVKAVTLMKQPAAPAPAPAPASKPLLRLAIPRSTVMQVKPSPAPTSIIRINPGILPQAPKYTLAELADNYNFAVNIAPHDVKYDPTRDLWYCDIEIKMPEQYTPFVRLALARYQPYAVNDCHLSKVVRADFIQLTPERSVTLAPVPGGTADQVAVTFTGVVSQTPKRGRAEVVVIIETKQPNTAANLGASAPNALAGQTGPTIGWVPAAGIDPIELKDDGGSPANYRGNITLPGDKSNYRLVIQEFEVLDGGWSPSNPEATRRLVFADAIPLQ